MADGPRSPDKPRFNRRKFLGAGAVFTGGLMTEAWFRPLARITSFYTNYKQNLAKKSEEPVPVNDVESPWKNSVDKVKEALFAEVNPDNNRATFELFDRLAESDELEAKKYVSESRGFQKNINISLEGRQNGRVQDISLSSSTIGDRLASEALTFFVNEQGEVVSQEKIKAGTYYSATQLKEIAKKALKNPPPDVRWEDGGTEDDEPPEGTINHLTDAGEYDKYTTFHPNGMVVVYTVLKNKY